MDIEIEMITIINAKTHIFAPMNLLFCDWFSKVFLKLIFWLLDYLTFLADTFYAMNDGSFVV
jgi:hypothetical protein